MTRKIPFFDAEKEIRAQVDKAVIKNGFVWSLMANLMVYMSVVGFLHTNGRLGIDSDTKVLVIGASLSFLGYLVSKLWRSGNMRCFLPYIGALLISLSYVLVSEFVAFRLYDVDAAEKTLIIGLSISIMSWHLKPALVTFSVIPIGIVYTYLYLITPESNTFNQVLTFIKFPILLMVYLFTVRQFFIGAERQFIKKIQLIHKLEKSSNIDELTKISNRRGFNYGLKVAIAHAKRYKKPLTLIMIDIDFFKQYNDVLGHPAGDWCLKRFAAVLKKECRRSADVVARIGGEEFALILPGVNAQEAEVIVDRIHKLIFAVYISHPNSLVSDRLTFSAGIVELKDDTADEMYDRADRAMYVAKSEGRNRSVILD